MPILSDSKCDLTNQLKNAHQDIADTVENMNSNKIEDILLSEGVV